MTDSIQVPEDPMPPEEPDTEPLPDGWVKVGEDRFEVPDGVTAHQLGRMLLAVEDLPVITWFEGFFDQFGDLSIENRAGARNWCLS